MKHHEPKINIRKSAFHDNETLSHPDSRCFMRHRSILIEGVLRSWNKLFHLGSFWFEVFHVHETNCFIVDSSWLNMFHRRFIAPIHPVSCWLNVFNHCFNAVSAVGTVIFHTDSTCFITVSTLFPQWKQAFWWLSCC